MANPLYQQLMGGGMPQTSQMMPMNNANRMMLAMQVMQNPAAFVKNAFPDIPDEIQNDPNQILGYLQRTRGITNQDIQNLMNR